MTTPRQKWKAAYRAARVEFPAAVRHRFAYDRMARSWTDTPRYRASNRLVEVCADALRPLGADVGDNPWTRDWRIVNIVEDALRPVESLQQKLGENVLNGFGMFCGYGARGRSGWFELNTRRHNLVNRMKARGLLIRDPSNHVREWGGFNGLLTSDRYGEFINQPGATA